jgi:phosphate transport system substrate-binding protein
MHPLITMAARRFERDHPQVKITLPTTGSLAGLEAMAKRQADMALSDTYADPICYPDPMMTDTILCIVAFAMIAHPTLPVATLSRHQLTAIFSTGTLHNWAQVGGPNISIVPVIRPPSSGTRANFRKLVLGGLDEDAHPATLVQQDSSLAVRDFVAHTPGAIGYLAAPLVNSSVKIIALENHLPTKEHIEKGTYSFWNYEHLYTLSANRPLVTAFLNFLLSTDVQDLMTPLQYLRADSISITGLESHTDESA